MGATGKINYNWTSSNNTDDISEKSDIDVYNYTLRSSDYSDDWREAKEFILNNGRGLGPEENLTAEQSRILNIIDNKAVSIPTEVILYRTDDTYWLAGAKVGDIIPIRNILMTTVDNRIITPENKGNVVQKMEISAPAGTRVFNPNNGDEKEIDVVRNQSIKIISVNVKEGIPVYKVKIV